ncbi:MAG: hypothetical protein LUD72_14660 [Bacteroidales bacterium]|nr:hypothetical protein [Bacteroidales bacterium]
MAFNLYVTNEGRDQMFLPAVEEDIQWTTERRGSPGKLTFTMPADSTMNFSEASQIQLKQGDQGIFLGFAFKQKRDKDQRIQVTAYDQIRYLENKDTYVFENKTASQLVKMLIEDFQLTAGDIEDTNFIMESRVEENTKLLDMIENALDLELTNKGEMYVLYDDFGKLALKNISNMFVKDSDDNYLMIDEDTGENYEYTSSIDDDTYDRIKLTYDNDETGKRDVYIAQDTDNINRWGILQYFDTLDEGENGSAKADALLSLYNSKTRNLKITNAIGDIRVRAGSLIVVKLDLGDIKLQNFMMVEKAVHKFKLNEHFMDLTLRGGEFVT